MKKEMIITILCLENFKMRKKISGKDAYLIFEQFAVFDHIIKSYNVYHEKDIKYINKDIDTYLKSKGYTVNKKIQTK